MPETQYTWNEIVSQPQVWRSTLERFAVSRPALERALGRAEYEQIITIGCGSTHYLAQCAAATLAHCTGIPARALGPRRSASSSRSSGWREENKTS